MLPDGNNGDGDVGRFTSDNALPVVRLLRNVAHMITADSTFSITRHNPLDDTDEEIAERVAVSNLLREEILPEDPPHPVHAAIAATRAMPERHRRYSFRVRDESGRLVGGAGTTIDPDHDDNPDVLWASIHLLVDYRRRGLGARLLAELVGVARAEGRTRILGSTNDRIEGGRCFLEAIGGEAKSDLHLNVLDLSAVDRAMLERWVDEAPERAHGYELLGWDGPVPDEHMAQWLDLILVMNTAPRDDLEVNDFTVTEEEVREDERVKFAAGQEHWVLVARRISDGAWAGLHDVTYDPASPSVVWVGATGVRPEHRGHALGKWLKAAMTLRVLDERPDVTDIRTGNADSNDAMLGINHQMGYRPLMAQTMWELPVEKAEAWLRARDLIPG